MSVFLYKIRCKWSSVNLPYYIAPASTNLSGWLETLNFEL